MTPTTLLLAALACLVLAVGLLVGAVCIWAPRDPRPAPPLEDADASGTEPVLRSGSGLPGDPLGRIPQGVARRGPAKHSRRL
jgi:hypothetical protein